jgi:mannose-1-phosphate guanylyltransferase
MLHAIIMAGGSGTRFWPVSRKERPKQLLNLVGERTMLQATLDRLAGLVPPERTLVVTNTVLVDAIREQLPELPPAAVIGEPCKRDTAPCVGLAAHLVSRHDDNATMLIMPSDHVIGTQQAFRSAMSFAERLIEGRPGRLVTFGIRPTHAAESFGYIERGEAIATASSSGQGGPPAFAVKQFREKPSAQVAAEYLASGNFYWNSGIFAWKARTILEALERYEPAMHERLAAVAAAWGTPNADEVFAREFEAIRGKSIDYAVMERHDDVAVIEAPFDWDDLGTWESLARLRGADEAGNTIVGKHLGIDTRGTIVRGAKDHLVVTVGLEDCIVVHTPDATLIAGRRNEGALRDIVKMLEERGWKEYL